MMDEDDVMKIVFGIETEANRVAEGIKSDLCTLTTGQKVDVLTSLCNTIRTLNGIHDELGEGMKSELVSFIKENLC